MQIKNIAIGIGAAIAGNYIAEKWVLKQTHDDPHGFVDVTYGQIGLDDLARAGCIVGVGFLVRKFLG